MSLMNWSLITLYSSCPPVSRMSSRQVSLSTTSCFLQLQVSSTLDGLDGIITCDVRISIGVKDGLFLVVRLKPTKLRTKVSLPCGVLDKSLLDIWQAPSYSKTDSDSANLTKVTESVCRTSDMYLYKWYLSFHHFEFSFGLDDYQLSTY